MIAASIATHFTARHSVSRQNTASATSQTAIMNKVTLYIFPLGVLVFGAFFLIGLLLYWLSNNGWTLMQQRLVYTRSTRKRQRRRRGGGEAHSLAPEARPEADPQARRPARKPVRDEDARAGRPQKPVTKAGRPKPAAKPGAKPAAKPPRSLPRSRRRPPPSPPGRRRLERQRHAECRV